MNYAIFGIATATVLILAPFVCRRSKVGWLLVGCGAIVLGTAAIYPYEHSQLVGAFHPALTKLQNGAGNRDESNRTNISANENFVQPRNEEHTEAKEVANRGEERIIKVKPTPPLTREARLRQMHEEHVSSFAFLLHLGCYHPQPIHGEGFVRIRLKTEKEEDEAQKNFRFPLRQRFELSPANGKVENSERWRVRKLQLINLFKHDRPVAYSAEDVLNVAEKGIVPTLPLNQFETSALLQLQKRKTIVFGTENEPIQVLGSICATQECLNCHKCSEGTLLGAFSYELRRAPLFPQKTASD